MRKHIPIPASFLLLAGCTFIQVEGAKSASVTRLGVLQIVPSDDAATVSYRAEGIGWIPTSRGLMIGYAREQAVFQQNLSTCRIVIFELPEDEAGRRMWRDLLSDRPDVCHVRGGLK